MINIINSTAGDPPHPPYIYKSRSVHTELMMHKILLIWFHLSCSGKHLLFQEFWSLSPGFVLFLNLTDFLSTFSASFIFANTFPRFLLLPYVLFPSDSAFLTCFFHIHMHGFHCLALYFSLGLQHLLRH